MTTFWLLSWLAVSTVCPWPMSKVPLDLQPLACLEIDAKAETFALPAPAHERIAGLGPAARQLRLRRCFGAECVDEKIEWRPVVQSVGPTAPRKGGLFQWLRKR